MLKSRILIALYKTVSLPDKGKIMGNKLLVLLAIGAISVAAFLACDNNRTPGTGPGNGSGTETPTPDLPRDQTAQINLPGDHTGTVQGHMTNAEWEGVAERIESVIQTIFDLSSTALQNALLTTFGRQDGIVVIAEKDPNFNQWKTTGDGRTMYVNISLDQEEFVSELALAIVAAFQNRESVDNVDVAATAAQR